MSLKIRIEIPASDDVMSQDRLEAILANAPEQIIKATAYCESEKARGREPGLTSLSLRDEYGNIAGWVHVGGNPW